MFLSRIELKPLPASIDDPQAQEHSRLFWSRPPDAYQLHQMVWTWFSDQYDRKRDFLYRIESEDPRSGLRIYTLSSRSPSVDSRLWKLDVKHFEPELQEGDRLAFLLRASPTVRRAKGPGAGKRHDVIMNAKRQRSEEGKPPIEQAVLVQEAGSEWLIKRAERLGAVVSPEDIRVNAYTQKRFRRKGRPVSFSQVDYQGLLTVGDPSRFLEVLKEGIGPQKSFGCGLMMIRRA